VFVLQKERRGSLLVTILLTQKLVSIMKCQFKRLKGRSQSSRALGQAQPAPKGIQDRFSSIFFVPFQQLTQNKIGPF
jgi:hypothetical protein